jgi:hypothetical protein
VLLQAWCLPTKQGLWPPVYGVAFILDEGHVRGIERSASLAVLYRVAFFSLLKETSSFVPLAKTPRMKIGN